MYCLFCSQYREYHELRSLKSTVQEESSLILYARTWNASRSRNSFYGWFFHWRVTRFVSWTLLSFLAVSCTNRALAFQRAVILVLVRSIELGKLVPQLDMCHVFYFVFIYGLMKWMNISCSTVLILMWRWKWICCINKNIMFLSKLGYQLIVRDMSDTKTWKNIYTRIVMFQKSILWLGLVYIAWLHPIYKTGFAVILYIIVWHLFFELKYMLIWNNH